VVINVYKNNHRAKSKVGVTIFRTEY